MAAYFDSDLLITKTPGKITLTLVCGYGQPVTTSVYVKNQDGGSIKIIEFDGNADNLELGDSSALKLQRLQIHSTIHDIRDIPHGQEAEDISLSEKIACNNEESVAVQFIKKTTGKGQLINCIYEVTII
jgi:hypothetical protein